jgi:hypothetical protein
VSEEEKPVEVKRVVNTVIQGRDKLEKVEDIVARTLLRASEKARYIQGETLVIDGGPTSRCMDKNGETSCNWKTKLLW